MRVLAIESSCDETAVAVVDDALRPWTQISLVASQDALHRSFGGVIPELASRRHVEVLAGLVQQVLQETGLEWKDFDGIAVTTSPGLMGALLVGLSYAKGVSLATGLPLIGVNHLAGHLASVLLDGDPLTWPHVGLVVSGGHTDLYAGVLESGRQCVNLLGRTRDDAAGEAFDKVAKLLGLGYPGGREIDRRAALWDAERKNSWLARLPRVRLKDSPYEFSFSGLKTAFSQALAKTPVSTEAEISELAFAFQERVFESLQIPVERALKEYGPKEFVLCGGVAANRRLRSGFAALCEAYGTRLRVPEFRYCTDNAAMIGAAGICKLRSGLIDDLSLRASPMASLDSETLLREFFPTASPS